MRTGWGGHTFLRELEAKNPALMHAHFALDASIALEIATELGIPLILPSTAMTLQFTTKFYREAGRQDLPETPRTALG